MDSGDINSEVVKREITEFLKKIENEIIRQSEQKEKEDLNKLEEIERQINELNKKVEDLEDILTIVSINDEDTMDIEKMKKYITIEKLSKEKEVDYKSDQERIHKELNGRNVLLFDSSVNLEKAPNDREVLDKINKFIGEGDLSIGSSHYVDENFTNKNSIEKYVNGKRNGIYSRRESGSKVRVYFVPINTKFFKCYYIIGVNYKDGEHLDAGCSTDDVYNQKMAKVREIENKINSLSNVDEVIDFINESKKNYSDIIKPVTDKLKKIKK